MNKVITSILLLLSIESFSQSPTFQALLRLDHHVDNNKFNLDTKPTKETFNEKRSIIWSNVYFKYFKNPNTMALQRPDESMKFSMRNQFLYRLHYTRDTMLTINLSKGATDKLIDVDLVLFDLKGDKITSTKLKSKNYTLIKDDKSIQLQVGAGLVKPGAFLQVLIEIESLNFKMLGPFSFTKPIPGNYNFFLSANIPDSFKYLPPDMINLKDKKEEAIKLKEFTNSVPPIADYNAPSYSYKWSVPTETVSKEIVFLLQSIHFKKNIGTSVEQLMTTSH